MKTRTIILLSITAIITLSFTFASIKKTEVKADAQTENHTEQAGGLASEDKI